METSFLWFGVFSGSFGVRSIVLCKCSGKYIDIYFKLKITYPLLNNGSNRNHIFFPLNSMEKIKVPKNNHDHGLSSSTDRAMIMAFRPLRVKGLRW